MRIRAITGRSSISRVNCLGTKKGVQQVATPGN